MIARLTLALALGAGVPVLLRVTRSNRDPEVRRKAIFWLAQSQDPRAVGLFEEILTRP